EEQEVVGRLTEAARSCGLDDDEILPTLNSGLLSGKNRPRKKLPDFSEKPADVWPVPTTLPEPEPPVPFPLEVFPAPVGTFVEAQAAALNCPVDSVGCFALGAAAGAIGRSMVACVSRSHFQPAVLYLAVVAPPGGGKSPAMQAVLKPLQAE